MVSTNGFTDIHSHLLPEIDDGCGSVEESLACVRSLMSHGFIETICTPHMGIDVYPLNTPAGVSRHIATLQEQLHSAGLNYRLLAGGELRVAEDTLSWLQDHGVPTLFASRYVLIDYWGQRWPAYADRLIEHLLQDGYRPILAHPERMDFDDRHWDPVLRRLEDDGVWLQGNLKCLAGREGRRVAERARCLLRENRYRVLATDMHGTPDLPDRLAGLIAVEEEVGKERVRELLEDAPRRIVADA